MLPELWILRGDSWTLPIVCKWLDVVAEVTLAPIPMLKCQIEAANKLLTEIAHNVSEGKIYVIKSVLQDVGQNMTGHDPESLVEWIPRTTRKEVDENEFQSPNDFVRDFCRTSFSPIRNPVLMDYVFASLCKFMAHWLIVDGKPIDLYFCRLVPLQIRKNWAPMLARMEQKNSKKKPEQGRPRTDLFSPHALSMIERGVADLALADELSSVMTTSRKWPVVDWTLEVMTGDVWDRNVEKAESLRQDRHGRIERQPSPNQNGGSITGNRFGFRQYYQGVQEQMKRQLPDLLLLYGHYLEKATQPSMAILEAVNHRFSAAVHTESGYNDPKWKDPTRLLSVRETDSPVAHCAVLEPGPDFEGAGKDLETEAETLPSAVPDLQSEDANLRNTNEATS